MKKNPDYHSGYRPYGNSSKLLLTMKMIVILLFCGIMTANATVVYSQNTKISLDLKNSTIDQVLSKIEDQSEFYFLLNQDLVDITRQVNITAENKTIKEVLTEMFEGSDVNFLVNDRQIILFPENSGITGLEIQQHAIRGKVTDLSTGEALPGVNIAMKGTTIGTISDVDGGYALNLSDPNATIVFTFIGYKSQEIAVDGRQIIDVALQPITEALDEVVVIGYGVQKKSVVTGAISSVKSEDLMNSSVVRAEQALQGKTAGVQVIQQSGAPGAGLNVRIRGYGSNKSSEPIYIVNGTRVTSISTIDPNDIQNIEILKDAASSAIYGAEGANGVVLITTKAGTAGQGKLTYEYQHGIQTMANSVDVLNATEYYDYFTEAGSLGLSTPVEYNTNWQNEIFETSPTDKHYLSFTGGSDRGSFMLSLSYLNQDGIVKGDKDKYQRYTAMFNSDYKLNNWIKVGHNISYTRTDLKSVSENSEYGSVISGALMMDPLTPVSYTGEIPTHVQQLLDAGQVLLRDENDYIYGISNVINGEVGNPFVARDKTKAATLNNSLFGNIFAEISPIKGLTITSRLGMTLGFYNGHTYQPVYYYNTSQMAASSSVTETMTLTTFLQWDNYATYTKSFGKHNTTLMVGMTPSEMRMKYLSGQAGPLTVDSENFDDLSYAVTNPDDVVSGYRSLTRKLSYFGRFSYDYAGKYMLQFSLRRDAAGADILDKSNRWGTFPAISGGWVISNESFFPDTFISFLKLRASWGQNGSISNLSNYPYASLLTSGGSYPISETELAIATYPSTLSNTSLGWETSEQTDVGLEIRAFNDRLTLGLDYYNKVTKGLITTGTPPLIAGNTATSVNAGDVLNRGLEVELGFRDKIGDFSYGINANMATLHNEVTYMDPNNPRLEGASVNLQTSTMFEVGYPIWYFYGYKTAGIDEATGDVLYYNADGEITNLVTTEDKQYIGSGIPKVTFGTTINLAYKGFDFKTFLQGQAGSQVMVGMIRTDRNNYNILTVFAEDRWASDNTDGTMPRADVSETNKWHSDLMLFDASFVKVRQIQLGYTIPKSLLTKIKASNARAYVSLENAFTFTKYPGMDPEVGSSTVNSIGIDRGMYPICRTILLGASITF